VPPPVAPPPFGITSPLARSLPAIDAARIDSMRSTPGGRISEPIPAYRSVCFLRERDFESLGTVRNVGVGCPCALSRSVGCGGIQGSAAVGGLVELVARTGGDGQSQSASPRTGCQA